MPLTIPVHDLQTRLSVIGLGRLLVVFVGLTEDEFVVAEAEGITVESHGVEVNVRVGALGLSSTAAVEIPNRQF